MIDNLQLHIFNLKIPFKTSFNHTSANRSVTQAVIIELTDGKDVGYGEGCPREYVTGESIESVFIFFNSIKKELLETVNSFETLMNFRLKFKTEISKNFAAWCAIELAFLDFFGRKQGETLEELLGVKSNHRPTKYSAVIGTKSFEGFIKDVNNYNQYGFKDFKLKLSGNTKDDYKKLASLKEIIPDATVRVDANNLWTDLESVESFVKNAPYELTGIEEPLVSKSLEELVELSQLIDCKIILDESFRTIEDIDYIKNHHNHFLLNLRISKQGGLLHALEVAESCIAKGVELIIGAQVGETAILTRASIALARCLGGHVKTMEGGFGTLFLTHDLTEPSLQFGAKGVLNLPSFISIEDKGNQLIINRQTIINFSDEL